MELITIATIDDFVKANLMKAKLEDQGIECVVMDSGSPYSDSGFRLKINESDFVRAKEIMADIDNTPITDESDNIISCPNCGSIVLKYGIKSIKGQNPVIYIMKLILFFIFPPIFYKQVLKCKSCGYEFEKERNKMKQLIYE